MAGKLTRRGRVGISSAKEGGESKDCTIYSLDSTHTNWCIIFAWGVSDLAFNGAGIEMRVVF